jgi:uncharacterized protein (TIGR03437 family)
MARFRKIGRARLVLTLGAVLAAIPAEAYYQYVHYLIPGSPNTPVFRKFDLTALPNKTVTFLVTDSGPSVFAPNDDFASVLSQVQQAAAVWNSVSSSDLRVAFGGVEAANQPAATPGGDVVFTELPPGLLGIGAPTINEPATAVNGPNGPFVPIVRATVWLSNDTTQGAGPSYLEAFFTTAVHEMGHALGLQHTFTGAAMSQGVIRNTSRTRPIDLDDIAGLSLLYGTTGYSATVGSISGQVLSNGQPVALASVVAITATGPAVSTLTNPNGTYRIDGLPPKQYWVYVNPAPPDAFQNYGIKGPYDATEKVIAATPPFETLFYPGTRDPNQFGIVNVTAGATTPGINFSVQPRAAVPVYDVLTYSYSGQAYAKPAFVNTSRGLNTIVAQAAYQATPIPQTVLVPGFSSAVIRPYGNPIALALDLSTFVVSAGPRHLLFSFGNDMYVLPYGLVLVKNDPPAITAVTPNADGTVTVSGTNFASDSRVYFDGLPAVACSLSCGIVGAPFAGNVQAGFLTVLPPPGYNNQLANLVVYNTDGQNSTSYQTAPATYAYPAAGPPQITVTPAALPAGSSAAVDITSANMQFVNGQITVGFGTFDVSIERLWLLGPNHAIANVSVTANATQGVSDIGVISGFQTAIQPLAFQIQPPIPLQPTIVGVGNNDSFQQTVYPGAYVSVYGANLALVGVNPQVTLGGQPLPVISAIASQINFQIPAGFPTGLALLTIANGAANSLPLAVEVDSTPPLIAGVVNALGQNLDNTHPVSVGDLVTVVLAGADQTLAGSAGRVQLTVSGVPMPVQTITAGAAPGTIQLVFQVTQSFAGVAVPLVVAVDSTHTDPVAIIVR